MRTETICYKNNVVANHHIAGQQKQLERLSASKMFRTVTSAGKFKHIGMVYDVIRHK